MNAKEKAQELVDKFINCENDTLFYWDCYYDCRMNYDEVLPHAKKCAMIAVDEIIQAIDFDWMEVQNLERQHNYWQQVKQEIEKL